MNRKIKCLLLTIAPSLLLTSCGGRERGGIVEAPNTINIKLHLGGYGSEWLKTLAAKFEACYANEGYKVNIVEPGNYGTDDVTKEISSGFDKTKTDIYFAANLFPLKMLDRSSGEMIVENLDDLVFNQKAIKYDGTEEEQTVGEKLDSSFGKDFYQYNGSSYTFLYQKSVGALAVNTKKLEILGESIPYTTKQFTDTIHRITKSYYDESSENYERYLPIITDAEGKGYPTVMINSWFTQYSGIDKWNEFWSLNNPDGTYNKVDGYKVFQDEGLYKAAENVFDVYDKKNFVPGYTNSTTANSHTILINQSKKGVFYFDGDWLLNESLVGRTEDELKDIDFINVPVVSALGTKLWGETITDEAKCDNVLARVVKLSDDGADVADIVDTVKDDATLALSSTEKDAITADSVLAVCKARGIYNNRGSLTGTAYVTKGLDATHKEIVGKFLRMFASDDFGKTYYETSRCVSPFGDSNKFVNSNSSLRFSRGYAKIINHKYATAIWPLSTGLRSNLSAISLNMFPNSKSISEIAKTSGATAYNSSYDIEIGSTVYKDIAKDTLDAEYEKVTDGWSSWTSSIK